MSDSNNSSITSGDKQLIGILAIQGAVEEHVVCMKKLGCNTREIRNPADIEGVDGIILPGGESTAMAIVGEECGLFPALKDWVQSNKPIWGTCAGMILLSDYAIKKAACGQTLVGGLDAHVCRNYFGSQLYSCELEITLDASTGSLADLNNYSDPFKGVFIRAPAILKVGPDVTVLARIDAKPHPSAVDEVISLLLSDTVEQKLVLSDASSSVADNNTSSVDSNSGDNHDGWIAKRRKHNENIISSSSSSITSSATSQEFYFNVAVAVKQNNILATAFHPELTNDLRWHRTFLTMVEDYKRSQADV